MLSMFIFKAKWDDISNNILPIKIEIPIIKK